MPNPEALCLQSGLHNMTWALKALDSPIFFFFSLITEVSRASLLGVGQQQSTSSSLYNKWPMALASPVCGGHDCNSLAIVVDNIPLGISLQEL